MNTLQNPPDVPPPGSPGGARKQGLGQELLCLLKGDRLVQAGLVVLVLTAALVIFVSYSHFPSERPLLGLLIYSTLPVLWVIGAIVFILAILRH